MKYSYKYLFVLLAAMSMVGCSFLEPDNKTAANQTAESFFDGDASAVRNYAYSLMKSVVNYIQLFEDGTDLYIPANKKAASDYDQYTFNVEDANVKGLYSSCYQVINMANCCIAYDTDAKYEGEMKFLRNYCYYILSQQFGGVPYVDAYINSASRDYPKESLMSLYDKILADLASIDLSTLPDQSMDGSVSQLAVKALWAKVALAAGWDAERAGQNANTYFTTAATKADEVFDFYGKEFPYSEFEDKWSPSNDNSNPEVIFAVQYDRGSWTGETKTGGHGYQNTFGGYYGDCTTTGLKYSNSYRCLNPKAAYLWEAGDKRWDATFMTEVYNAHAKGWGTEGYFAYYNGGDQSHVCMRFFNGNTPALEVTAYTTANADKLVKDDYQNDVYVIHLTYPSISVSVNGKKSSEAYYSFINSGSTSGMFSAPSCKKFDDPQSECIALNQTNDYRDIVILNLSDIVLVAAEANLKLGQEPAALGYINKVRARSGASTITSFSAYMPAWKNLDLYQNYSLSAIDLILDERARELFAEGYRWTDLHRTGKLVEYNQVFNYVLNGHTAKNYRPIPQAEINANNALTADDQNEEWR